MTVAFRWPSALNRASRCFDTSPSRSGTAESGFPIVYLWQKQAQTATGTPVAARGNADQTSLPLHRFGWWNGESTNRMPSPMVAKGDSRGMKQKAAGKKSLLIVTPSQAITNLDNLAVRMVNHRTVVLLTCLHLD
jgi:hypothetical protein